MLSLFSILYEADLFGTCLEISLNFPERICSGHLTPVLEAKVGGLGLTQLESYQAWTVPQVWSLAPQRNKWQETPQITEAPIPVS